MPDHRLVVEVKRDGGDVEPDDLRAFILGYARGEVHDYLAAASSWPRSSGVCP
jgi:hypothetical protein